LKVARLDIGNYVGKYCLAPNLRCNPLNKTQRIAEAVEIFGWPNDNLPFLVRPGHRKPLAKPAQNAHKWFASLEIEPLSQDPHWLHKAIRIVEKQIHEMNERQRAKPKTNPLYEETANHRAAP
jgi:hypothetical protein